MNHRELQTAIKALRDSGTPGTPPLNSKTIELQAWLESYNRKQTTVVEEVTEYPKGVDPYTGLSTSYEPPLDEYEQNRIELLENCVNVTYYSNGVVRDVNKDTLYCELPTPRNIAAEYIADIAPDYWANWDTTYTTAIASLTPVTTTQRKLTLTEIMARPDVEPTEEDLREFEELDRLFSPKVVPVPTHAPINHGEVGIALCLMCLVAWQLVATLLIPLITQTFYTVRKIMIDTTLIVKGFKQAASIARKTLQTA